MAIDALMSFVGTYDSVEDAEADHQLVKTLHTEAGDRPGRGAVPFRGRRGGLLAGTTAGGAILGAVAGHAAAGMSATTSRISVSTWMPGTAGLVVVDVSDMGAKVAQAMERAAKLEQKPLKG